MASNDFIKASAKHAAVAKKNAPKFGINEIASGLANPSIQGAGQGTDIAGGKQLADSVMNVGAGKANVWDVLNIGLAATAFAGLGAPAVAKGAKIAAEGVKSASKAAAPVAARKLALNALKNPQIAMQLGPDAATSAIKSGEFKNVFQLGEDVGQLPITAAHRVQSEKMMGIPISATGAERPKYGLLTSPIPRLSVAEQKPGAMFGSNTFGKPFKETNNALSVDNTNLTDYISATRWEGNVAERTPKSQGVVATFNKDVANRATYTRGDSNPGFNPTDRPPVFNPSTATKEEMKKFADDVLVPYAGTYVAPYYIEAQIFGKLGIDDVKKFVAGSPSVAKTIRQSLKEVGKDIPVTLSNRAKIDAIKSAIAKLKPVPKPKVDTTRPPLGQRGIVEVEG